MEQYLDQIAIVAGGIVVAFGFIFRNWASFEIVYKTAKSAFWIVEEIAIKQGLVSEEKAELFEEKFRLLMKWALQTAFEGRGHRGFFRTIHYRKTGFSGYCAQHAFKKPPVSG